MRLTELQGSKREVPEPESAKWVIENKREGFPIHESESEVEPSSGNAKTERRGKGIWYPEELDRNCWSG